MIDNIQDSLGDKVDSSENWNLEKMQMVLDVAFYNLDVLSSLILGVFCDDHAQGALF